MQIKLPKRLVKQIATEYGILHASECKSSNQDRKEHEVNTFFCTCNFFEEIHKGIVDTYGSSFGRSLKAKREELGSLNNEVTLLKEKISKMYNLIHEKELQIGNIKIELAIEQVLSKEQLIST